MKRHHFLLPLFILFAAGCGSSRIDSTGAPPKEESMLLGPMRIADLRTAQFPWFEKNFAEYKPDGNVLPILSMRLEGITILCFAGTWCSDTHLQLPRLVRILSDARVDMEILRMYGIDRKKQSPGGEAVQHEIRLSPTFIFLRDGKEIGRIEETPKVTLEMDMLAILSQP